MSEKYLKKIDRNNTNFTLQLENYFKNVKFGSEYDFLKYYQNMVRAFANDIDMDARGQLVVHEMGLGKSILAISIAMDMIKERQPIVLLTKSLQENMRESIHKYANFRKPYDPDFFLCKFTTLELDQWIDVNFKFVSMNASNMLKQMSKAADSTPEELDLALEKKMGEILTYSLDGKLLIVDEAHNFARAVSNGSKNAYGLYEMIMKSKNLKIVFLTGTPIPSHPFELVPLINSLGSKTQLSTLPENYRDFENLYVDKPNKRIKNKEKFQNRIMGLISFVDRNSTPGRSLGISEIATRAEFPTEKPIHVVKVPMGTKQYVMYGLARDKEKDEGSSKKYSDAPVELSSMVKPKSHATTTYRVKSRQLSNYCPPEGVELLTDPANDFKSNKFEKILENLSHSSGLSIVYSQFVGLGGLGAFAMFLNQSGWEEVLGPKPTLGGGSSMPSVDEYLTHVESELNFDRPADDSFDITGGFTEQKKKYAIISGAVDVETRTLIKNTFNSEENKNGGLIDLLLLSSTGAEGLDLKNVKSVHIMEPYWNWSRVKQIVARAVRNDSHAALQPEERFVTPYIYLSIPPETESVDGVYPETTDIELYEESISGQMLVDSFMNALKEVSIECVVNGGEHCRRCNPTGQQLYTSDAARDVRSADPCRQIVEHSVKAKEIIVDDTAYYFVEDKHSLCDYKIFIKDEDLGAYKPMKESDPKYEILCTEIKNQVT